MGNAQGWFMQLGMQEMRGYARVADRSFISTAFSSLINIAPTPLENCYDVELADGKLVRIDTIIRGCTLNFLDHPFNIDLMLVVENVVVLTVIIKSFVLRKVERERIKVVQLSHVHKDQSNLEKGCQSEIFLSFPDGTLLDFLRLDLVELTNRLNFQESHTELSTYRLAPSEMKELSEKQLQDGVNEKVFAYVSDTKSSRVEYTTHDLELGIR
ncbi:hypothetical protein Tco_0046004 [Tanacetum coccineum]